MGRFAMAGLFACSLLAGCALPGDKATCGFHVELIKPPTINTESPVLVQTGTPIVGAHPMGTVSGPVQEGQYLHGPAAPPMPAAPAAKTLMRMPIGGVHAPCQPGGVLSVEDWCRIQTQMNGVKQTPQQ